MSDDAAPASRRRFRARRGIVAALVVLGTGVGVAAWFRRPPDRWRFLEGERPVESGIVPPGTNGAQEYRAYCLPRRLADVRAAIAAELRASGYRPIPPHFPDDWTWVDPDGRLVLAIRGRPSSKSHAHPSLAERDVTTVQCAEWLPDTPLTVVRTELSRLFRKD